MPGKSYSGVNIAKGITKKAIKGSMPKLKTGMKRPLISAMKKGKKKIKGY